jgi:hypothetical protein
VPGGEPVAAVASRRRTRGRKLLITVAALLVLVLAATARLIVWPVQGMPARVSAIVALDSPGQPLDVAFRLAGQHRAAFLVVSQGRPVARDPCPPPVPGVTLICFTPNPATTRGEAEFVGRLARKYHWQSIAVVAITPQASRARLRFRRCFPGHVHVVTVRRVRPGRWAYEIGYEWAALSKAFLFQQAC